MSDVKIQTGILSVRVTVGAGVGSVQPGVAKQADAGALVPPPPADGFHGEAAAADPAPLTGQAMGPPLPAADLARPAQQIDHPREVLQQFQAAYTAARDQLLGHPDVPRHELGQRANEFFTEYAGRFVQTATGEGAGPPPEQKSPEPEPRGGSALDRLMARTQAQAEASRQPERAVSPEAQQRLAREFADALKALGFQALKNLASGKDGVENAFQLLTAENLQQFAALAKEQKISIQGEFPPRPLHDPHDALPPPPGEGVEKKELGESPAHLDGRAAGDRARSKEDSRAPGAVPQEGPSTSRKEEEDEDARRARKRPGRRGLWGLLGSFRRDEAVREAEERWDRVAVAALLFLLFVALVTVALVSL